MIANDWSDALVTASSSEPLDYTTSNTFNSIGSGSYCATCGQIYSSGLLHACQQRQPLTVQSTQTRTWSELVQSPEASPLIDALVDLIMRHGVTPETLAVLKALAIHPAATAKLKALIELTELADILD